MSKSVAEVLEDRPKAWGAPSPDAPSGILKTLTKTQRKYVSDGALHGDVTMATISVLRRKGLFQLVIDSPNGRCGMMHITPLGKAVQKIIKDRSASLASKGEA
jgi:hypothetical protein